MKIWPISRLFGSCLGLSVAMIGLVSLPGGAAQTSKASGSLQKAGAVSIQKMWVKIKSVSRNQKVNGSTFEVSYPQFVGAPKPAIDELNRAVAKMTRKNLPAVSVVRNGKRESFEYNGNYDVINLSPELVSVEMIYSSFTGGAHPNGWTLPFNYKMTPTGAQELTLENVFGKKPDLKALQKLIRPRLIEDLCAPEDRVNEGTATFKDLSCFTINKDGLNFTFQQYQVSGYATGTPRVTLDYEDLDGMFDKTSPIFKQVQLWRTAQK